MTISSTIQTEIMGYQDEFLGLMWDAVRALKERFPDPEELALKVNQILKEPKSRHVMFETPPTSHYEIFSKLQNEWSYTNPKLLRLLIQRTASKSAENKHHVSRRTASKHTASSTLEERMENYCQRYQSFCKSLQITTASRIVFEAFDSSKPCLILTIQKGPLTLEEIYIFLVEEFNIYNRYFRIHRIDPGSIKVILQFPVSMTELIETCIEEKCKTGDCLAKKSLGSPKHYINDKLTCNMKTELPEKHTENKQPTTTKKSSSDSQDMLTPLKKHRSDSQDMLTKKCICAQSRRPLKLHKGHGKRMPKIVDPSEKHTDYKQSTQLKPPKKRRSDSQDKITELNPLKKLTWAKHRRYLKLTLRKGHTLPKKHKIDDLIVM